MRTVTTTQGAQLTLGRRIGQGGQGSVFAVEGQRRAVKLVHDRSERARQRLRDQLAMVGRLDLEGVPIARPLVQLRSPDVGYVMELFTGMTPIRTLLRPPREIESPLQWYLDSGGLRRRLRLLARVADALAMLHGRGLIFVDPSPGNVLIASDRESSEIRLLDPDNLRTTSAPGLTLHTPLYGAPELVRGSGMANSLSDVWAFAVLAFELLSLAHPLLGDAVRDGTPEDEERALAGALPWIDAPDDTSNRASVGVPREIVLSPLLSRDFQACFGAGRLDPQARPGMMQWAEHLDRAASWTLACSACGATYYADRADCPWCDAPRPPVVALVVHLHDPERLRRTGGSVSPEAGFALDKEGKPRVVDALVVGSGQELLLSERVLLGNSLPIPALRVSLQGDRVRVAPEGERRWSLQSPDGKRRTPLPSEGAEIIVGADERWRLHTGEATALHRVLRFLPRAGGRR